MNRIFALFLLVCFIACSGDNGTAPKDPGGGGGGVVTHEDSVRVVTVGALTNRLDQWQGSSADTIAARASRYLKGLPDIGAAGITDGTTVWATFKDGVQLIIPNNRGTSTQADTLLDERIVPAPKSVAAPRHVAIPAGRRMMSALRVPQSGRELPASNKFRALNAIGTCHDNPLPVLKSLLSKGHYVDVHPGTATVEELEAVRGEGVFYINTHGGLGANVDGHTLYGLWTATPYNSVTAGVYASELKSSELIIMVAYSDSAGICADHAHIGITSRFVTKYMKFGKQSLVIVDACSGASENASWLRDAFAHAGASAYVGWTKTVGDGFAYRSMKYLLDRLLGVNEISPEDPKQRAFNIDQVLNDMRTHRNLVEDPTYHGVLTVFHLKDDFGLLSPTIQFLSIDDDGQQPKLIVAGLFGTDPGEGKRSVTINDQPLDNVEWYPTELYCDIPESGSSASGTVVVKVGSGADARESNPVNITEWNGELTYERDDPGSQTAEMKIKLRILADIHSFRDEPGEEPFETTVLFNTRGGDVGVKMTTGGVYERTIASCKDTFTLGENGEIGTPFGEGGTDGSWTYFGSVDTKAHMLQLNIAVLGIFKAGQWVRTRVGPDPCDPFTLPIYATMVIEDCLYDLKIQAPAFQMQMDNAFVVAESQRGPCDVDPLTTELNEDFRAQAKIKWGQMSPSFLPDPDAAR
jgi:hypothetical protein